MEQLVARRAHNPKVIGSSPVPATLLMRVDHYFATKASPSKITPGQP
jgi:hypothetical protein